MPEATDGAELSPLLQIFEGQRHAYVDDPNPPAEARRDRLDRMLALTTENETALAEAISADFGHRSQHETAMAEVLLVLAAARHARRNLRQWMRPRRVPTPFYLWPGYSQLRRQPLGVVGVISPWNYPFQLALAPAIAAIAAGNRVMLKPSEHTPRLSALLAALVDRRFAAHEMAVVTGDAAMGKAFASLPFNHLLFTGSTAVGREIALAAARNLTPVTLELGGKSPAIIDEGCDIDHAGMRIVTGKLLNAGQTCIAPDYVLVPVSMRDSLIEAIRTAAAQLYPVLAQTPDYSSIAGDRHRTRLVAIIEDARARGAEVVEVNPGGEPLSGTGRMPLVLLKDVNDGMRAMQEELFGPVLPLVTYRSLDDAISYVNARPRPLALYWFGTESARRDRVLDQTVSGGVTVNDTLWHFCQENLPFGGVGASGSGRYHGEHGFLAFSQEKPVFYQRRLNASGLLRAPYGRRFESVMRVLRKVV